ncbi:hypothetical protein QQX98_004338 [Neonectria punicea]|uniref:Uncharacterized protein n=1 Tax=Neonectria punicea TaxID=979145 RepID=A0ABR1H9R5_9HYPO
MPGIAFSLTPEYGTAAIYFQNSSYAKNSSLCDSLPSSVATLTLGFCDTAAISDFETARALLDALKASVAAYLDTTFCFAHLVMPDSHQLYQKAVLEKSLTALSSPTTSAMLLAPIPPEQAVLIVDYSRSGLRLALFCDDDDGIVDVLRWDYYPELGLAQSEQSGH